MALFSGAVVPALSPDVAVAETSVPVSVVRPVSICRVRAPSCCRLAREYLSTLCQNGTTPNMVVSLETRHGSSLLSHGCFGPQNP